MTEEEKKAIEFLKEWKDVGYKIPFKTILNLIDKQQKEIEEKNITINKMAKDISIQLKEIEELNKQIQRIYDTQRNFDISDIGKSNINFN